MDNQKSNRLENIMFDQIPEHNKIINASSLSNSNIVIKNKSTLNLKAKAIIKDEDKSKSIIKKSKAKSDKKLHLPQTKTSLVECNYKSPLTVDKVMPINKSLNSSISNHFKNDDIFRNINKCPGIQRLILLFLNFSKIYASSSQFKLYLT